MCEVRDKAETKLILLSKLLRLAAKSKSMQCMKPAVVLKWLVSVQACVELSIKCCRMGEAIVSRLATQQKTLICRPAMRDGAPMSSWKEEGGWCLDQLLLAAETTWTNIPATATVTLMLVSFSFCLRYLP